MGLKDRDAAAGVTADEAVPPESAGPESAHAPDRDRKRTRPGRAIVVGAALLVGAAGYAVVRGLPGDAGGSTPPPELDRSDPRTVSNDEVPDDGVSVVRLVERVAGGPDAIDGGDAPSGAIAEESGASEARGEREPAPELAALLGARPVLVSFDEPRAVVTETGRHLEAGARASDGVAVLAIGDGAIVLKRDGRRLEAALPEALARRVTADR